MQCRAANYSAIRNSESVSSPDGSTQFLFLPDASNHKSFSYTGADHSGTANVDVSPFDTFLIGSASAMTKPLVKESPSICPMS